MPTWAVTWIIAGLLASWSASVGEIEPAAAVLRALVVAGITHVLVAAVLRFALAAQRDVGGWRHWADPWASARRARRGAVAEAHAASLERVRGNVRLMGLAELWGAVSDDDPEVGLLERAQQFCRRETGHLEIGLLTLDARALELRGHWIHPLADGARWHRLRWALGGLQGGIVRALRTERPVVVHGEPGPPLLTVNGERPRLLHRDRGYAVFPLVSAAPLRGCADAEARGRGACEAYQPHAADRNPGGSRETGALGHGLCASCRRLPLHGVLVVTQEGGRGDPSPGDLGLLESLATTMASVLEHAALFRDVKNAERFREQVLDAMTNGLLSTDAQGRIVFANRTARELVGDRAVLGERLDSLLRLPEGGNAVTRTLLEDEAHLQADGLLCTVDGADIPVRLNLTPFRPEEGGRTGAVCVVEDRRSVRAMEAEIRHLDTLAAIGRFASSLAHEIRNPLGGIQAGIEFLGRSMDDDADTQESLSVIHGEIRRLDGILRNLLTVAKPRELVLGDCEAAELARRSTEAFRALAETVGVEIRVRAHPESGTLHADRDVLLQVLTNLLKNAIEASSPDSSVELTVGPGRSGPEGEHGGVVFEVLDRGPGIDEADLPHLFEPFFSRKSNGTGLGLYVCHGLVQRHGGDLRAENRPGGGARFVLELPRVPALMGGSHEPSHSGGR